MDDCCALASAPATMPLALQVLSLGLIWTSLHCAGMCGPLIASFRFGFAGAAAPSPWRAAAEVGCYQGARAVVYAGLGAAAGALGQVAGEVLARWAPVLALVLAAAFALTAARGLLPARRVVAPAKPGLLAGFAARAWRIAPRRPLLRAALLGGVLAFMPCMLVAWVLSLAAASRDPLHGAGLAVLLVVMTVPVLLAAAVVPATVGRARRWASPWIGRAAMAFSALWLALVGLAGLAVIPHAHLRLGDYVVMFW